MARPVVLRSASEWRRELLDVVLEKGYTRAAEPFRLSSGGLSYDYVDLRRAVADGADLQLAAQATLATLEEAAVEFDAIGGMTMGADPVAHAVAILADRSWFSVRKAEKDHGPRNRVEGTVLGPGRRAVVFEDTVSTGRSILDALDVVLASGSAVACACTILDRGEQARGAFAERGVPYVSLLSYADLGIEPLGGPGRREEPPAPVR